MNLYRLNYYLALEVLSKHYSITNNSSCFHEWVDYNHFKPSKL